MPEMNLPNLFLVGAPKTGTTALFDYLSTHPAVFAPDAKEPHFFSDDFPRYGYGWLRGRERWGRRLSREDYLRLYRPAESEQSVSVDGSVLYLFSEVAIRRILEFNPDAKFVVMLRDPVDLTYAWHATMVKDCVETEVDFERAWRLQNERRTGRSVPSRRFCPEPIVLQYGRIAKLGEQLQRLCQSVPAAQLRVYQFDDFRTAPGAIYRDVLNFVDLPNDGRSEFPAINSNGVRRVSGISRYLKRPPFPLNYAKAAVRFCLHRTIGSRNAWRLAESATTRTQIRIPLDDEFRAELRSYFAADQQLLVSVLRQLVPTAAVRDQTGKYEGVAAPESPRHNPGPVN